MKSKIMFLSLMAMLVTASEYTLNRCSRLPDHSVVYEVVLNELCDKKIAEIVARKIAQTHKNTQEISKDLYDALLEADPYFKQSGNDIVSTVAFVPLAERIMKKLQ